MSVFDLPRVRLAILPTPLVQAPTLSNALGVEIWFKRDDLTGFGLGGNKVRALEFLIGDAKAREADCLVTGGGPQSNWVFLAALAAHVHGLPAHLAYFGPPVELTGNLLLVSRIPGISIRFTGDPARESVDRALADLESCLHQSGHRPYVVGRGGAGPIGALGYLSATFELDRQLEEAGTNARTVWLAAGSCATQAGLVAGHSFSKQRRIIGVSVHRTAAECRARIISFATEALTLVKAPNPTTVDWVVVDTRSVSTATAKAAAREAHELCIRTEGVFLDPEFGSPAMAELVAQDGRVEGPVVFLVSGGAPSLLAEEAFR